MSKRKNLMKRRFFLDLGLFLPLGYFISCEVGVDLGNG